MGRIGQNPSTDTTACGDYLTRRIVREPIIFHDMFHSLAFARLTCSAQYNAVKYAIVFMNANTN